MSRLVHAGSAVVDYVYRIDTLPSPGMEKTATSHDRVAGGGFNLMVAARRAGMEVVYAGRHGTGPDGDFLRAALPAGFQVRRCEEPRRAVSDPPPPPTELTVSGWHEWPWSLLALVPEATAAAWAVPDTIVWLFELSESS